MGPQFEITDENGDTYCVPATFEPDDFVVATGNDGETRLYGTENNLDDQPPVSGQYVNVEHGLYEDDLPDNVLLIEGNDEEDSMAAAFILDDDFETEIINSTSILDDEDEENSPVGQDYDEDDDYSDWDEDAVSSCEDSIWDDD